MKKSNQTKVASVLSVAILLTGTFAWQSFSQMALNESSHLTVFEYEVGGRLHDHYNGSTKEVFVENYADVEDGTWVYARVRLDEYYEFGTGAGTTTALTEDITVVRGDLAKDDSATPSLTDLDTWDTYLYGSTADGDNIREFRDLEFGGKTVYMPTFNKNHNSLDPDYNGTYAGTDGDRETDYDRYGDYVEYTVDEESAATQVEYADPEDEDGYLLEPASVHVAKETAGAIIMSMTDWVDGGKTAGNFWVYDDNADDGWFYWANPIKPQTATGRLLKEVTVVLDEHDEWYYAVNVVAQLASAGDWGQDAREDDYDTNTGMYLDISDDAITLLDTISAGDTSGLNNTESVD